MSEMISPLEAIIQGVKAKLDEFKATWPKEVEWDYVMDWDGTGEYSHIMISMGAHGYAFPVFHLKQKNDPKSITDKMIAPESRMFSMWRQIEQEISTTTVKEAYETVLKKNRKDIQWWIHPGCKDIPMSPDEVLRKSIESIVTLIKNPASSPPDDDRDVLFSDGKGVMYGFYGYHSFAAPYGKSPKPDTPKGFLRRSIHDSEQGSDASDYEENIIWWMELPDPK